MREPSGKYKDKDGNPIKLKDLRKSGEIKIVYISIPVYEYLRKHRMKSKKTISDIIKDLIKYRIEHQKCHI